MLRARSGSLALPLLYVFTMRAAEQSPAPSSLLAVRVKEACRLTGIGRSKLYLLIREGHIQTIKVGSMTLIPCAAWIGSFDLEPRRPPSSMIRVGHFVSEGVIDQIEQPDQRPCRIQSSSEGHSSRALCS